MVRLGSTIVLFTSLLSASLFARPFVSIKVGSLSPQVSDLVLDLGKKEALIATVQRYSGALHDAISLGSFLHPNLEKIFALRPDWIVTDDTLQMPVGRLRWEGQGTRTAVLRLKTVQELGKSADRLMEEVFGDAKRVGPALELCLRKVKASRQSEGTVLIFVSMNPPFLAGRASFLNNLAEIAGHRNLAKPEWVAAYPLVTEEWLITHRPDRVFLLDHGYGELTAAPTKLRKWWPTPPPLAAIPAEPFAKSSLHVLTQWESWGLVTPPECHHVL